MPSAPDFESSQVDEDSALRVESDGVVAWQHRRAPPDAVQARERLAGALARAARRGVRGDARPPRHSGLMPAVRITFVQRAFSALTNAA
jgi:hypothetical protein